MKLRYLSLLILMACSFGAFANGYIGFSMGRTSVKADLTSVGGGNLDETTNLSKFYAGYRLNKYVSLEAAYYNLAKATGQVDSVVSGSGAVDMKAGALYGVASVPLAKRLEAYVKAGAARWDAELVRDSTTASADGVDAFYGLGISYGFTKAFAVTADWEVIDSPNPEFSTLSAGFKWEFR